jgi:hypothetical protein
MGKPGLFAAGGYLTLRIADWFQKAELDVLSRLVTNRPVEHLLNWRGHVVLPECVSYLEAESYRRTLAR